ncbi:MAG TPA: HlyD family efflux transporter periplasmic adaptor subunit [Pseudomonadota bacterium]|nr:HlyD family efflux transporter periplasmic adaptor subunit [Pseudomonadota bacterium]
MSHRDRSPGPHHAYSLHGRWRAALSLPVLVAVLACQKAPSATAPLPTPSSEATLGRVTLSAQAETRLGISTGLTPLATSRTSQRRLFRGEVIPPPGRSAWLCAPHAGIVLPASGSPFLQAQDRVQSGQVVVLLSASLAPTERAQLSTVRVDADAQVARAKVQDEASELALQRAERLLAEEAVGSKVVDDAKAQRDTAKAALQAALSQQAAVGGTSVVAAQAGVTSRGVLSQTPLVTPLSGRVKEVRVSARQLVLAGAPLVEIVDDEVAWVRVPVPAGATASLPAKSAAYVEALSASSAAAAVAAPPAEHAPVTASPQQSTVDRYFVLPQPTHFEVGQTVAVWLTQGEETDAPIIAANALLYDATGGTWVYQQAAPHSFVRRRVEVIRIAEGVAFLSHRSLHPSGLRLGDLIVTAGAMEIFGTEFGSGK